MTTIEKLKKELSKVDAEISMKNANDGWWNLYMEERKQILENLIKDLDKK